MPPPRWFKNIEFGRDVTNHQFQDIIDQFKSDFQQKLGNLTFSSTLPNDTPQEIDPSGPIIEELVSEDEQDPEQVQEQVLDTEPEPEPVLEPEQFQEEEQVLDTEPEQEQFEEEEQVLDTEQEQEQLEEEEHIQDTEYEHELFQEEEDQVQDTEHEYEHFQEEEQLQDTEQEQVLDIEPEQEQFQEEEQVQYTEQEQVIDPEPEPDQFQDEEQNQDTEQVQPTEQQQFQEEEQPEEQDDFDIGPFDMTRFGNISDLSPEPILLPTTRNAPECRRSSRNKHKPVDFARGERLIYNIKGDLIGHDPGFPAHYDYSRKCDKQVKKKKKSIPANCRQVSPPAWKPAKKGKFRFYCKQVGESIQGGIELPAGERKSEAKTTPNQMYSFWVSKGQVILKMTDLKITESVFLDSNDKNWFELPLGMRYSIKNCGTSTAVIAWILTNVA